MSERPPSHGAQALLTLKQAARFVGIGGEYPDRALLRILEAREVTLDRKVLLRSGKPGKGQRYRVTLAVMREVCPEFFSHRDTMAEALREQLEAIDDRIADLYQRDTALAHEVKALKRTTAEMQRVTTR